MSFRADRLADDTIIENRGGFGEKEKQYTQCAFLYIGRFLRSTKFSCYREDKVIMMLFRLAIQASQFEQAAAQQKEEVMGKRQLIITRSRAESWICFDWTTRRTRPRVPPLGTNGSKTILES